MSAYCIYHAQHDGRDGYFVYELDPRKVRLHYMEKFDDEAGARMWVLLHGELHDVYYDTSWTWHEHEAK